MLAEADVDAAIIASPISLHYEQVVKAIEAGKHVHRNKTITNTAKEATEIIEAAKKKSVKVVASLGKSAGSPIVRRPKQIIREGTIGKVYWVQWGMLGREHEYEPFRRPDDVAVSVDPTWYHKQGNGPMYDIGVYRLHAIIALLGLVEKVAYISGIRVGERVFKGRT